MPAALVTNLLGPAISVSRFFTALDPNEEDELRCVQNNVIGPQSDRRATSRAREA